MSYHSELDRQHREISKTCQHCAEAETKQKKIEFLASLIKDQIYWHRRLGGTLSGGKLDAYNNVIRLMEKQGLIEQTEKGETTL